MITAAVNTALTDWQSGDYRSQNPLDLGAPPVALRDVPQRGASQVAALLVSISRNNDYEGRDPHHVPDNLTSGFIAELLGLSILELAEALLGLQQRRLVRAGPLGLWLENLTGLEVLACQGLGRTLNG